MNLLLIITIFIMIILIVSIYKNRYSIFNGFLFLIDLVLLSTYMIISIIDNKITILYFPLLIVFFIIIIFFSIQTYVIIASLLINAYIVFKKESKSIANSLTFFLAISLIFYLILSYFANKTSNLFIAGIWIYLSILILYFYVFSLAYLSSNLLARIGKIKYNIDYIIVLGAGLVNDKITPLLKARVDVAITFANKQYNKTKIYPKIIMSGGQGEDEAISEAKAMAEYAKEREYDDDLIILEDKAKTTYENMLFSKDIIEKITSNYNILFATSSYHVFRAGQYAKKVGLNIRGLGSKTAKYFVFNAFLREEIAIVFKHKKIIIILNLIALAISIAICCFLYYQKITYK